MDKQKKIILAIIGIIILVIVLVYVIIHKQPSDTKTVNPDTISATSAQLQLKNEENIKASFQNSTKENKPENYSSPVNIIEITDNITHEAPELDVLSSSLKFHIPPSINQYLYQKSYLLFYCPDDSGKKDYGIGLNVRFPGSNPDTAIRAFMKDWENTMLIDLHNLLFPNITFSQDYLEKPLSFRDGSTRFAEVILPDGSKSSINYKISYQSIFISSALDCLIKGSDELFD
jgi:hypothetical protein